MLLHTDCAVSLSSPALMCIYVNIREKRSVTLPSNMRKYMTELKHDNKDLILNCLHLK